MVTGTQTPVAISGSRIYKTGEGGVNPKEGCANLLFSPFPPKNCLKFKKIGWDVPSIPLDPPMQYNETLPHHHERRGLEIHIEAWTSFMSQSSITLMVL